MKQKLSVAPTLKNYDKKNLPKDILAGIIIMAVSIPISMGLRRYPGYRRIWLVWLGIPNHIVCSVFHITAVYIRCGCCSGGACRSSSAWHGNRGRKQRGHDG